MTISGGKIVNVPLGKMGDRDIIIDNTTPVSINGKPATLKSNAELSTTN